MPTCKLTIIDEVNVKLDGLDVKTRRKIANQLKYELPYARHMPAYKLGRWDGTKSFFGIGGTGYLANLDVILPIVESDGYTIEIEDRRPPVEINFATIEPEFWANRGRTWPKGHQLEGQPVVLRDYQHDMVNKFLRNPQSILEASTGAGKCRSYDSTIAITVADPAFSALVESVCENSGTVQIGQLAELIEQFRDIKLINNQEVDIRDLGCTIDTPSGPTLINQIIKKTGLTGIKITLDNGVDIKCAAQHILRQDGRDVYAEDLTVGDSIETRSGPIAIANIDTIPDTTFYDISIDAPHLYYDPDGVLHHNTVTIATMSHLCEPYGRTMVVVPNKSLVQQTQEDFEMLGLDVGVYYGDRKDLNRTHTICTWQSLNILDQKKYDQEAMSLAEFAEGVSTIIVDECLSGDTLITTPTGKVPIRDIKPGDTVVNLCEKTQQFKTDTVVDVHQNLPVSQGEPMLELEFDNGQTIQVTANHKFLTTAGWLRADQITKDHEILAHRHHTAITSCREIAKPAITYNLHVKDDHNYIANDAVVANCHQMKANVLHGLLTKNFRNCMIRWGLTGTIPKEKWEQQSLFTAIGPLIHRITAKELQDKEVLAKVHINILQTNETLAFRSYADENNYLTTDRGRLEWIASKVQEIAATGNTLVLINRIETGKTLNDLIPDSVFVSGAVKTADRKDEYDKIKTSDNNVIVATYGVASTGINIVRIFNLVLIEPGKSFVRVIQSIGRGIRKAHDKDMVEVWDITSACKFSKRHLTDRKRYYREASYPYTVTKVKL